MNYSIIRYIICRVLEFIGLFLAAPCLVALIYGDKNGFVFGAVMLGALLIGVIGKQFKPKSKVFFAREGFVTVSLSWILLSVVGALPFYLSGSVPSFTDALYETVSGFTTTGSSVILDVEVLSRSMQFWRLFTHWIGGMGVLVLIMAVLPLSGSYNMHLMRAESSGPAVGKLVPKVRHTAMILYGIYVGFTVVQVIALMIAGLPLYDALTMSFSTMGTGGFGIVNSSAAGYSVPVQTILMIFMLLCGINFNIYYLFLIKKPKEAFKNEEVRFYLGMVLISSLLFSINVRGLYNGWWEAFRQSLFHTVSITTTTGLSIGSHANWPEFSRMLHFILLFAGACAGSTAGGFKSSRLIILTRTIKNELAHVLHPKSVKKVQYGGHNLDGEVTKSVQVFLALYVLVFLASVLLVSVDGFSFTDNMSAVASCLNNVGLGIDETGAAANHVVFSPFVKYVLMFDMLVGRLEFLPMLLLIKPGTWKK